MSAPTDAAGVAELIGRRLDVLSPMIGIQDVTWCDLGEVELTVTGRDAHPRRFRLTVEQIEGEER